MSRALVRHAAAQWLTAAEIPGLRRVEPGKVQFQAPQFTASDSAARAMAYILLDVSSRGRERRIAFGGPYNGQKEIDHRMTVVLHFWSPLSASNPDWLGAQDAFDDIFEGVLAQIRSGGRTLGRPDDILSAGEAPFGVEYHMSEPVALNGGTIGATGSIDFATIEIINA